jgi:hypothetical protein
VRSRDSLHLQVAYPPSPVQNPVIKINAKLSVCVDIFLSPFLVEGCIQHLILVLSSNPGLKKKEYFFIPHLVKIAKFATSFEVTSVDRDDWLPCGIRRSYGS